MLRISRGEDRAGALRARAPGMPLKGARFAGVIVSSAAKPRCRRNVKLEEPESAGRAAWPPCSQPEIEAARLQGPPNARAPKARLRSIHPRNAKHFEG